MKKILKISAAVLTVLIVGFLIFFFGFAASITERTLNPVISSPPYQVSASTAVCGEDAASIARAIKYASGVAGIDHIGLGSDFDGSVKAPFDTSGEALITEALIAEGFSDDDIGKIMGGNVLKLLTDNLPD